MANHPLVVIAILLALCLEPFANKAIHIDDPRFIWAPVSVRLASWQSGKQSPAKTNPHNNNPTNQ